MNLRVYTRHNAHTCLCEEKVRRALPRLCSAVSVLSDAPVLARAVILRRGNTDADATRLRPLRTTIELRHAHSTESITI
eukprot:4566962-Pleurochrysis_carterae.AAC.4